MRLGHARIAHSHIVFLVPLLILMLQTLFAAFMRRTRFSVSAEFVDFVLSVFDVSEVSCVCVKETISILRLCLELRKGLGDFLW